MQEQRIRLLDSTGNILYQWGRFEPATDAAPNAVLHLPEPLEAWRFEYFLSTAGLYRSLARSRYTNLFIALVSVGLILAFLVIYFYRESSRELREAGQRVTFVNRVSHELKTPLTNVRMYGELLEREIPEGNQKAARCMYVILSESRRLSRLIGNILSFARKRRNTLKLHTKAGVVDEVLATVISHFRPALREKGVEVVFHAGAPGTVVFDHDALEQIMGNLFNNVEKYAGEGGVMEVVSSRKGAITCITVKDRGPGVPEDQREKIFLPFHRVSNRLTDGISGTGIGLSIARELARLHGGDLVVKEGETKGACFQATLQTPESTP
jgi:signal transduction histidine kinase